MDKVKLRAWWSHRQGLDGRLAGKAPEDVLRETGWSRSVGGANPYLALFARAGTSREEADRAVAETRIHELPSARGCTYIVPAFDYVTAISVSQGFGDSGDLSTAVKFLGVTYDEIDALGDMVCGALKSGPQDPRQLKGVLGDAVRSFGDEGKKRGVTTTLPLALGKLQTSGRIRRIPVNGRIDNQRYAYALWEPSPLAGRTVDKDEAFRDLARLYFKWIGPASIKNFQWLSGLGVKASKDAVEGLGLVALEDGSELMIFPEDLERFNAFQVPNEPQYVLTGSIDNVSHLRLGLADMVDPGDAGQMVPGEKTLLNLTGLTELLSNSILDRGRLVGVWEYDTETESIAWVSWVEKSAGLFGAVARTESFIKDQLGDARTFSLDSPESRKPRIADLRELALA